MQSSVVILDISIITLEHNDEEITNRLRLQRSVNIDGLDGSLTRESNQVGLVAIRRRSYAWALKGRNQGTSAN